MSRLVILGTGTGIGKTYVSCALARALAEVVPTARIRAFKPLESGLGPVGTSGVVPHDSDSALLAAASSPPFEPPRPPYWLASPVSPHLAARRQGLEIELEDVRRWCDEVEHGDATLHENEVDISQRSVAFASLYETAGAVFSPVTERFTNFDLAKVLGEALWILVAPDRLGVLHDLRTTLECMRARGRAPDVILLSQPDPNDTSAGSNQAELERLDIAKVDALIRFRGVLERSAAAAIWAQLSSKSKC
ncbi:MAG: dethiobiotin synthase [Polyangiaceae bacterium]